MTDFSEAQRTVYDLVNFHTIFLRAGITCWLRQVCDIGLGTAGKALLRSGSLPGRGFTWTVFHLTVQVALGKSFTFCLAQLPHLNKWSWIFQSLGPESVVCRPGASTTPRSLLEIQSPGSHPRPYESYFNKIPKPFIYTSQFEEPCSGQDHSNVVPKPAASVSPKLVRNVSS